MSNWTVLQTSQLSSKEKFRTVCFVFQLKLQISRNVLDPSCYSSPVGAKFSIASFFSEHINAAYTTKHSDKLFIGEWINGFCNFGGIQKAPFLDLFDLLVVSIKQPSFEFLI